MVDLGQKRYAMRTFFIYITFLRKCSYEKKHYYGQTNSKAIVNHQILVAI
jgi:hypothetical protein